jgi:hypothetical protein
VKLALSQVDRAAMASVFLRPSSRGGSVDVLLAQDDLHSLLGMDEFMGKDSISTGDLSAEPVEVEIPDSHVGVLREMLGWPGQQPNAARIVAGVIRRLM